MELLLGFFTALCISMVLVPLLMRYARAMHLVDEPRDKRRVHETPVPRTGGIAIAVGALFPLVFWLPLQDEYRALTVGMFIILAVGLVDDFLELSYRWKFLGQLTAALALLVGGVGFQQVPFFGLDSAPVWVSWPLTIVFVVGVTNAVNLTDGLDGLAAGTSLLSLIVIAALASQIGEFNIVLVVLAVIGGLLGFLRYNTHPAQVFMGDTGSQFLGFVTVALALMVTQHEESACSALLPVLILGLPILDTLSVIAIRLVRGRFIFSPDRSHLHHQLMRAGFYHYEVVATLYVLQAIMVVLLYQLRFESDLTLLAFYALFCSVVLGFIAWTWFSGWQLHKNRDFSDQKERRNRWLRGIPYLYKYSTSMIEWGLVLFMVLVGVAINPSSTDLNVMALILAAVLVVFWLLNQKLPFSPRMVVRCTIYATCLLVVYVLLSNEAPRPFLGVLIDGYLVLMVCLLILAIRTTRKALFRLNNQDYLVLVLVMLTPMLPTETVNGVEMGRFALRAIILLYACEFVISKRTGMQPVLFGGSIACLLSIGLI